MSVGNRIQLYRKAAGLSQKELGKRLGVSGSMIGQYENNLRKPKRETLQKIANALNVSAADLAEEKSSEQFFEQVIAAVSPREAVHTLIESIYGRCEGKIIERPEGDVVYYCVGEGENEFFLLGHGMSDIFELVLKFLSMVVEANGIHGTEDALRAAYTSALGAIENKSGG